MNHDVLIRRRHKHEAETAINDLIERGYEVVYPLVQAGSSTEKYNKYTFEQIRYQPNEYSTPWIAKLRRANV